jgi:hypothetical protein
VTDTARREQCGFSSLARKINNGSGGYLAYYNPAGTTDSSSIDGLYGALPLLYAHISIIGQFARPAGRVN